MRCTLKFTTAASICILLLAAEAGAAQTAASGAMGVFSKYVWPACN